MLTHKIKWTLGTVVRAGHFPYYSSIERLKAPNNADKNLSSSFSWDF